MSTNPGAAPLRGGDTVGRLAALTEVTERARTTKHEINERAQAAEDALFGGPGPVAPAVRHGLAALAARWHGSRELVDHHTDLGADPALFTDDLPEDPALRAAARHVDLLSVSPALAVREDVEGLTDAGWDTDAVVVVSQIAAFTSFQARVVHGLRLLEGQGQEHVAPPARTAPGRGRVKNASRRAANGGERPVEYTRELLSWTAWPPPVRTDDLTEEQAASFRGKTNGEYFRLLSRVPGVLAARTALDAAVFTSREGLPRAERELAATATSKVNDCVYCASVHARKAAQMADRPDDVQRLLDAVLERDADWRPTGTAPLAHGQEPRWAAVTEFAAALATTPSSATAAQVERLRGLGLSDLELTDLVFATSFFSWANRLMLTLGDPYWPGTADVAP